MTELDQLNSWNSDWRGLRVAVIGLGVSGFSVADTLSELGAQQLVLAEKAEPELVDILDVLNVPYVIGEQARIVDPSSVPAQLTELDPELLVTSPGVRPDAAVIQWANQRGLPIWTDIDLAWRLRDKTGKPADWFAVTGTNGKTTTVQLLQTMLLAGGKKTMACGNIGTPILDAIRDPQGFDALVVELSSFQLHYLGSISPFSSAVLNLADDHLDWHGGFENYRAAKAKIYENTQVACVYNVQDQATEQMVENADVIEGARAIGFTTGVPARSQVGFVEEFLVDRAFIEDRASNALEIATEDDLAQIGVVTEHLKANVAAATAMARSYGVSASDINLAIRSFRLDAHRIELVANVDGINWIDDSKATNPHATNASLASFESVIWVVGGLLKGVDIEPLVRRHASRIKAAVVIGADRTAVLTALAKAAPGVAVFEVTEDENSAVMPSAVAFAASVATQGDTVLLAPAAASMDQFKDYADRGYAFQAAVKAKLGVAE